MINTKCAVITYQPTSLTKLSFVWDRFLDPKEDFLDMFGLGVAIGVQVCHSLETLLHKPVFREPSWCVRQEERHDDQDEGKYDLDDERTTEVQTRGIIHRAV